VSPGKLVRPHAHGFPDPQKIADPVGPVEVGEHQDVEQSARGAGPSAVETFSESALQLVRTHAS
jgi:hypothetical protein